jgi:hypothetical protein
MIQYEVTLTIKILEQSAAETRTLHNSNYLYTD